VHKHNYYYFLNQTKFNRNNNTNENIQTYYNMWVNHRYKTGCQVYSNNDSLNTVPVYCPTRRELALCNTQMKVSNRDSVMVFALCYPYNGCMGYAIYSKHSHQVMIRTNVEREPMLLPLTGENNVPLSAKRERDDARADIRAMGF